MTLNMATRTPQLLYGFMYALLAGIFFVSLILFSGVSGVLPFDISIGAEQGSTSFLVVRDSSFVSSGGTLAAVGEGNALITYTLTNTLRRDGVLFYRVVPTISDETLVFAARELPYEVLTSAPLLGTWVRALQHPAGLVGLIVVPFIMFVLDMLMVARNSSWMVRLRSVPLQRGIPSKVTARQQRRKEREYVVLRPGLMARIRGRLSSMGRGRRETLRADAMVHEYDSGMTVELPRRHRHAVSRMVPTGHRYGIQT